MTQMSAMSSAVETAHHRCSVAKVLAMIVTITALSTLVENAGLSLPRKVGIIAGTKASWHTAITVSCHMVAIVASSARLVAPKTGDNRLTFRPKYG